LGGPSLRNIRTAIVEIRQAKLPDHKKVGNAGSFFKNPVVEASVAERIKAEWPDAPTYPAAEEGKVKLAAGWLIDKCGWKGGSLGRAGVHDRQALVLINLGGATAQEVITLADTIRRDVAAKFGVDISPEVNIV
jgi:UDP-N-acetylmuramate dehydrogenase